MVRVAPVRLAFAPQARWFNAQDMDFERGDAVVVNTARGAAFGTLERSVFEVPDEQVKKLGSPLQPVLRLATEADVERAQEVERKSLEALPVFKEYARTWAEDMNPVAVEFLFGEERATFYFESENRVDFRALVKQLSEEFSVRISMKQIGVRDKARMVGGCGHCGQELCCHRIGGKFCTVGIRMAKEQDLSLNPQNISGACGRLMCCLRYEYDMYKDFKKRAPKKNAKVHTPDGVVVVRDLDMPREMVTVAPPGGKAVRVPLADMERAEGAQRPNQIGAEAWERAQAGAQAGGVGASSMLASQLTESDKLSDPTRVRLVGSGSLQHPADAAAVSGASGEGGRAARSQSEHTAGKQAVGRRKRRARHAVVASGGAASAPGEAAPDSRRPKRKKETSASAERKQRRAHKPAASEGEQQKNPRKAASGDMRPGRRSSELRARRTSSDAPASRVRRRRSHKLGDND